MTSAEPDKSKPAPRTARCAICGREQVMEYRPFCSKRCADIDLSRWLHGVYAIPSTLDSEEDEAPARPEATNPSDNER